MRTNTARKQTAAAVAAPLPDNVIPLRADAPPKGAIDLPADLVRLADYALGELKARDIAEADYTLADFMRDAIHERASLIVGEWVLKTHQRRVLSRDPTYVSGHLVIVDI